MASDLKTHPDTDNRSLNGLAMIGMMYVTDGDKAAVALDRTFSMTEAERPLALSAAPLTCGGKACMSRSSSSWRRRRSSRAASVCA
jgi:hypothetical protein